MTYKINRTDGLLIAEVVDGSVNQVATDLTLVGKNVAGYGEFINENFVKLLENFANTNQPNNPIAGQLWFDTTENKLKVYDGNVFKNSGSPIVSPSQPANLSQGDLWIDSLENQLYFYDGTDLQLAGPIYKQTQGISGFTVDSVLDTTGVTRTVLSLWVAETLIGIFSKETTPFTPRQPLSGFNDIIMPGFNQSTLNGLKFNVTSAKADTLAGPQGSTLTYEDLMLTSQIEGGVGTQSNIIINNDLGLRIGKTSVFNMNVSSGTFQVESTTKGNIAFRTDNTNAIYINGVEKTVGIFKNDPNFTLDVGGSINATYVNADTIDSASINTDNIRAFINFQVPILTSLDINDMEVTNDSYGTLVYNSSINSLQVYSQSGWMSLTGSSQSLPYDMSFAVSDELTAITTGTNLITLFSPRSFNLDTVAISLTTPQTSGNIFTVDIKVNNISVFNNLITIANGQSHTTSVDLISTPLNISQFDRVTVDVTQVGDGTAKGLKIYLLGSLA